jgi:hypothetical protein
MRDISRPASMEPSVAPHMKAISAAPAALGDSPSTSSM